MNCPGCGTLAYPHARKCHGCDLPLAWPAEPIRDAKPLPPDIQQNLEQIGFSRMAGETPAEFAARCRRWMLDRFVKHERNTRAA